MFNAGALTALTLHETGGLKQLTSLVFFNISAVSTEVQQKEIHEIHSGPWFCSHGANCAQYVITAQQGVNEKATNPTSRGAEKEYLTSFLIIRMKEASARHST